MAVSMKNLLIISLINNLVSLWATANLKQTVWKQYMLGSCASHLLTWNGVTMCIPCLGLEKISKEFFAVSQIQ